MASLGYSFGPINSCARSAFRHYWTTHKSKIKGMPMTQTARGLPHVSVTNLMGDV